MRVQHHTWHIILMSVRRLGVEWIAIGLGREVQERCVVRRSIISLGLATTTGSVVGNVRHALWLVEQLQICTEQDTMTGRSHIEDMQWIHIVRIRTVVVVGRGTLTFTLNHNALTDPTMGQWRQIGVACHQADDCLLVSMCPPPGEERGLPESLLLLNIMRCGMRRELEG